MQLILSRIKRSLGRYLSLRFGHLPVNFRPRGLVEIESDVDYAIQVANGYSNLLSRIDLTPSNLRVLELGPGINCGPQLLLASQGAQVTVADRYFPSWNPEYHPAFYRLLRSRWLGPSSALDLVIESEAHCSSAISCISEPAEAMVSLPDETFDLTISNAVLEHVSDAKAVSQSLTRVTKSGGFGIHQIDFRDHLDFKQPLEFLLLSRSAYERVFRESHGERGNRLRFSEWLSFFKSSYFDLIDVEINESASDDYLRGFIPTLRVSSSSYRTWAVDDLRILGARILVRKSLPVSLPGRSC
jgi:SAM-dependent methyltransferase